MSKGAPVCPGETVNITCHASANPAPTYSWIRPDSRSYSGATIEAELNGVYTCNASSVIRGSTHSDKMETTVSVGESVYLSFTRISSVMQFQAVYIVRLHLVSYSE